MVFRARNKNRQGEVYKFSAVQKEERGTEGSLGFVFKWRKEAITGNSYFLRALQLFARQSICCACQATALLRHRKSRLNSASQCICQVTDHAHKSNCNPTLWIDIKGNGQQIVMEIRRHIKLIEKLSPSAKPEFNHRTRLDITCEYSCQQGHADHDNDSCYRHALKIKTLHDKA